MQYVPWTGLMTMRIRYKGNFTYLSRVKDRFRVNLLNQVWTVQDIGLSPVEVLTPED